MTTDFLIHQLRTSAVSGGATSLLVQEKERLVLFEVGKQGPPGPPGPVGPKGPIGDSDGALLASNRLSELAADPQSQADAQANLGLGLVDPLAYYILAKS